MKKRIIKLVALILISMSLNIQAGYKIIVPLESKDGGYLSDGSINMGNSNTVPETPSNNKECHYDETIPPTNGYYMWVEKTGDLTNIWYATQMI